MIFILLPLCELCRKMRSPALLNIQCGGILRGINILKSLSEQLSMNLTASNHRGMRGVRKPRREKASHRLRDGVASESI